MHDACECLDHLRSVDAHLPREHVVVQALEHRDERERGDDADRGREARRHAIRSVSTRVKRVSTSVPSRPNSWLPISASVHARMTGP